MTEPVFIVLSFSTGDTPEGPACITSLQGHRTAVYQHLSQFELDVFEDNLSLFWEAEWFGDLYELHSPITQAEADEMAYRCELTEDMFS